MRYYHNNRWVRIPGRFYVVQFSDSLYTIAQKFNVTVDDILAQNEQIDQPQTIFPGEVLLIPTPQTAIRRSKKKRKK
jgi:LysM repeat protein